MNKRKVIMHTGFGNLGVAAMVADLFFKQGWTSCVMELGGIHFHLYYTKTGTIVVHEISQN